MSSDAFTDIEIVMQSILNSIEGHPYIEWENEPTYNPTLPVLYWRVTNIPGTSLYMTSGLDRQHPGVFKVDVFCPRDLGIVTMMTNLGLISQTYTILLPVYKNDTKVKINAPYRGLSAHEPAWFHSSVKIPYIGYN